MAQSEARKRSTAEYKKRNAKRIGLIFYPPDHDIYDWAKSHENTNGYIKGLIREDMNKPTDIWDIESPMDKEQR